MNYYVTHCDSTFLKYAERLFETLSIFSDYKIIFYTVDFDYKPKLCEMYGMDLPPSVRGEQRLTGMTANQATFPTSRFLRKF